MKPRLALLALLAVVAPRTAHAQRGIDNQVFKPALDSYGIFGTERARTSKQWDFGFRFYFNYAQNPLHLSLNASGSGARDTTVVDSTATFHLGAHLGLTDRLELAFDIPITRQSLNKTGFGEPYASNGAPTGFYQTDPASNITPTGALGSTNVTPGDMRWGAKLGLWRGGPLAIGGAVIATLPFGDETEFLGTHSFTVEPRAILDFDLGRIGIAINGGYRWHDGKDVVRDPNRQPMDAPPPIVIADSDEIVGSAGLILHATPFVSLAAEVTHLEPVSLPDAAKNAPKLPVTEVVAGLHVHPLSDITVAVGGGLGVQDASRQEDFLVLVGLSWAPEGEGGAAVLGGDRDRDGIPDAQDLCPDEPEDRDGFEDEDGCPDPDNDQDGIPDAQDRCPNEPEDRDGFQDDDGCPDPDNDGDGIPDAQDKCPNEPETFNGVDDDDGCPDVATGGRGQFQISERILFAARSGKVEGPGAKLLDEVAARLKRNPQVRLVRIEGHTDSAGNAASQQRISQQRAEAVREYLIKRGVEPGRLQAVGYGAKRPIDTNATAQGRAKNRRVEMIVVE